MSKEKIPYKIYLSEAELPTAWYNLRADMINKPEPLLSGKTLILWVFDNVMMLYFRAKAEEVVLRADNRLEVYRRIKG